MGSKDTPIDYNVVINNINKSGIKRFEHASIREIRKLINDIESETDKKFIRMEMGVPGLPTPQIAIDAEIDAIRSGVTNIYPNVDGIPDLKQETQRFIKLFLDIDIDQQGCIPTVGSINGMFAALMVLGRANPGRDTVLFIEPGFPVQKQIVNIIGLKQVSFDVYPYRGNKLKAVLEKYLVQGNISSIVYSNPNNPTWICFNEEELRIIGELSNRYNVQIIEDLAYFAMDFRKDLAHPGIPPFQSTVAKYTDNYIMLISSSKSFSYAGQRIGMMAISDKLYHSSFEGLCKYYSTTNFGRAVVMGTVYVTTAGVCHSAQYGLAAVLKAVNDGKYDFVKTVREYGKRAKIMKSVFQKNGFNIVYDKDIDQPIGDGFYFTFAYPGMSGEELLKELLFYGVSAIGLSITGSERTEGLRACVSQVSTEQLNELDKRLHQFMVNHPPMAIQGLKKQKEIGNNKCPIL